MKKTSEDLYYTESARLYHERFNGALTFLQSVFTYEEIKVLCHVLIGHDIIHGLSPKHYLQSVVQDAVVRGVGFRYEISEGFVDKINEKNALAIFLVAEGVFSFDVCRQAMIKG